jgi:glutathione S-transferase
VVLTLRSTKNCTNTPRVMFALEELGLQYEPVIVEDGVFSATWGSPGPSLQDGEVNTIEPGAILRHLVRRSGGKLWPTTLAGQAEADRWIEFQSRRLSRAVENKDAAAIVRLLGFIDARVSDSQWLVGDDFTMADVMYALLASPQARKMLPLAQFPALSAYLERLCTRPAFARALARYAASQA